MRVSVHLPLPISVALRTAALTVVYFVCFAAVSAALLAIPTEPNTPDQSSEALAALWIISIITSVVFAYVILRSRWAGWKLALAVFLILYGVTTVMSQIETAFFVTSLPPGMLRRLFLAGAIISAIFSPLAVLILGKRKSVGEYQSRLNFTLGEWLIKLSLIVIAYVVLYFTFGYYIAWQSEAVHAYYGGSDPGSLLAQMN